MRLFTILVIVGFIILWRRQSKLKRFLLSRIAELEMAVTQLKSQLRPGEEKAETGAQGFESEKAEEKAGEKKEPEKSESAPGQMEPPPVPGDLDQAPSVLKTEPDTKPETVSDKKPIPSAPRPAPGAPTPAPAAFAASPEVPETAPTPSRKKTRPRDSEFKRRWKQFAANVDWELFTGVKLFAWMGGLALFIGAGFFVKYSIDRNLIPPAARLAIGAVVGMGLILWTFRFNRERYETLRQTMAAGGIGVLYTVVFAATIYYEYLPRSFGFGLLCLVSAAAFVLSVYHRGVAISVLGALGAYATPLLVSTGQGGLGTLFTYLVIVNIGLFEVMRRLGSGFLLLFAVSGTLGTLLLGTFAGNVHVSSNMASFVWISNLALFTVFIDFLTPEDDAGQAVSWSWNILYWGMLGTAALLLLQRPSNTSVLMASAAMIGADILAFRNRTWYARCLPYSVLTFVVVLGWAFLEFDPRGFSLQFVVFLLYGAAGGIGPVALIQKHGIDKKSLLWLKVFPLAVVVLGLGMLLKWPMVNFWFWPMILALQMIGILVSLLIGAMIQVGLLTAVIIAGGVFWMTHAPPVAMGAGFFSFLLVTGVLMLAVTYLALRYLPGWISGPGGRLEPDEARSRPAFDMTEWMKAAPVLGAFILLGVTFYLQRPLDPHPGMATLACFTGIAVFLGKRISFSPLAMAALLACGLAQCAWMISPPPGTEFSAFIWALAGFILALVLPFVFFGPPEKWDRVWMAWSVFELFQAAFIFRSSDFLWGRHVSGFLPAGMAFLKLPTVYFLLKQLKDKASRNAVLAFHGGVLLLYVSSLPVIWFDKGWLGVTLVIESAALLWLNRRIFHPGLRWVSAAAAPGGLVLLLLNIGKMKGVESLPILNEAVLATAMCLPALVAAKYLAGYPKRRLSRVDLPNYFLWLALGTGFFLVNLSIADLFGETGQRLLFSIQRNFSHALVNSLAWAVFGAGLWRFFRDYRPARLAGLAILVLGCARMLISPILFPKDISLLHYAFNIEPAAFAALAGLLFYMFAKEPEGETCYGVRNLFLALFLCCLFVGIKLAAGTVFQPGRPFRLFFGHTLSMATASSAGWLAYGFALAHWPKKLDPPFRTAGMALILFGLIKAAILPMRFPLEFGQISPLLNVQTLVFLFCLAASGFMVYKKELPGWPFEKISMRMFWAIVTGVFAFWFLNVEIASVFGDNRYGFSLMTRGIFSHQLAYSLGWLCFAIGLLGLGIRFGHIPARWTALVMIVITALKIFFKDLWSLGQLYRVGSFVGLAAVLIMVSFLYQRYLSKGSQDEK